MTEAPTTLAIAVLGNPVLDRVVRDGQEQAVTLGGTAVYAGAALARLGARVLVVGGVGTDFPAASHDQLAGWGLDLGHLWRAADRPSTACRLEYRTGQAKRRVRRLEPGPRLAVSRLPADLSGLRAIHLGAVAGELTADALDHLLELAPRPLLGVDLHLIRQFDGAGRVRLEATPGQRARLARADVLKGSFEEIRALAGDTDVAAALPALALGGAVVLATDGPGAGLFCGDGRTRRFWPYPVSAEDVTGAGDVFLASYLFARAGLALATGAAVRFAAAAASFVVEHRGVAGLGDLAAVRRRAREIRID